MTASTPTRVCLTVLFALVSMTGSAMAVITTESGVSANNVPIIDPQGVAPLVIDDGTAETAIGDSGQFIWLNRFTPAAGDFPFQLEEVSAIFAGTMVNVGDSIEIVVYEDTDGDGDPGTGSVLVASFNETIQFNDQTTFNVFTLPTPVVLTGPGDVSIGIINRYGSRGFQ